MSIAEAPVEVGLPTHLDLPETDGKPVENAFEHPQSALLSDVLLPVLNRLHPDDNYFVGADTGIYWYHARPNPLDGCKSPDWYYVPNVPRLLNGELRRSYVQWHEKAYPLMVIEYVSGNGDEERDTTPITGKFWVYEHGISAVFYLIWDAPRGQLEVYELVRGRYQRLPPDPNGRVRIGDMDVSFGVWHGEYHGYTTDWLRAWDRDGNMLLTADENAEALRLQVEQERQRADKLAARLRELGVDPDSV
jgi:Uma2 family endonuclease